MALDAVGGLGGAAGQRLDYVLGLHARGEAMATSVLLQGPSGSGKTLLVEQLCQAHGIVLHQLEPAKVFLRGGDETPLEHIDTFMLQAALGATSRPAVVLIKRCHELVPKDCGDEALTLAISSWLGHCSRGIVVIAACSSSSSDQIHPVWLGSDLRLSISTDLGLAQRRRLLEFFAPAKEIAPDALDAAALYSAGFLACDLHELGTRLPRPSDPDRVRREAERIRRSNAATAAAASSVEPVSWSDIAGQAEAKEAIQGAAAFLHAPTVRQRYASRGLAPPRGILLHGPPGTGKTLLARATATASSAHFISVSLSELVHAPIGESEKAMRRLFVEAARLQPSILFFDEIDALVASSEGAHSVTEKIVTQLVEELDALPADALVLLIAATNLLDLVHPALRRFGRLDREIHVGPLTADEQRRMLSTELARIGISQVQLPPPTVPRTGAQVEQCLTRVKYRLLETTTTTTSDAAPVERILSEELS